jgi:acetyl-CoA C-acetyltransferase
MTTSVIVAGARTPFGKLLGGLSQFAGAELGAIAIGAALQRSGVHAADVDYVIMGQVLTAGAGQLPVRQASIAAGIGMAVPTVTVSKVCLSGIQAVIMADQFVRTGDAEIVVAGGQESMTNAPHLVHMRQGHKFGPATMVDHMAIDGLEDPFTTESMGLLAERKNDEDPLSRLSQDEFSARSHLRAAAAWENGLFSDEIVPVSVPARRGEPVLFDRDEGVRPETTVEVLSSLKPAFRPGGTVTAGNASPISDGACALIVMSKDAAERAGMPWIAEIVASGMAAGPDDTTMQFQPANAIEKACAKAGITPAELDLIEINEAFAAVPLASAAALGVDLDIVNVNGGAIAMGHPIGASGARLVLHLALELRRRGGGVGAAALCGGGGQGDAVILRVPAA